MTEPGNRYNASLEGKPQPGQWWLQTDKQDRSDAKFFRVFFCGRNSLGRMIFEDADGNTEVDHGCDWSGWHHEPACTGWDWVAIKPEPIQPVEWPQWYSYKDGAFASLSKDVYLIRCDSISDQFFVHRSGKIQRIQYPYYGTEFVKNVADGVWKKLSGKEAKYLLHPELNPVTTDVVAESPDDWVTQDRVNARNGVDEFRWIWRSGNPSEWHSYHLIDVKHHIHGYIDKEGDRFELRCRRKDLPVVEEKRPLPCSYCSKPEFKGWVLGKCPYCGEVKEETVVKSPAEDPGEGYRFVNSDEVVLETDERAYVYEDSEATGLIWGEVDKAVWFEAGKTAADLRRKLRARNVVFRRKAVNAATVTVYEVLYGDEIGENGDELMLTFCTSEKDVNRIRDVWKYVSVVSTKTVEVML